MPNDIKQLQVRFVAKPQQKAADGSERPDGFIAGYASTDDLDCYNSILAPGCFSASIAARGLKGPRGVKLLVDHNWSRVAGVITKLEQQGARLYIEAQLNLAISYARDVYEAAKMNEGLSFSVGFYPKKWEYNKETEIVTYTEADLIEVSVVAFPANIEAEMTEVKSANNSDDAPATIAAFERMLVAKGLVEGRNAARRLTQEVKRFASLFQKAASAPEAEPPETAPPVPADEPSLAALLEELRSTSDALAARAGKSN